jgi:ferredoxin
MTVTIDSALCIGSGECVRVAPHAFQIDESRGVSVPQAAAASLDAALLAEVVRGCPTRAISAADATGARVR